MASYNLLDIVSRNNDDGIVGLVDETIVVAPEMVQLPAGDIPGQSLKSAIAVAHPTVGFRDHGEGVAPTKTRWENRLTETFIVDASVEVDEATLDSYAKSREQFFAEDAEMLLRSAWESLSSQFYYGTATTVATSAAAAPTKGFPGVIQLYDSTNKEVDATGTSTSGRTSVWFVKKGRQYVRWVIGKNGKLDVDDPRQERLTDSNSNPYDGWRMPLKAYVGLQGVNPKNSLVRIKNLTAQTGKGLTDALLASAWGKVEDNDFADWCIFMHKQSLMQLQQSRTATSESGKEADIPDNWQGIPIYATKGIKITEAA
jgi:hypothetical protein